MCYYPNYDNSILKTNGVVAMGYGDLITTDDKNTTDDETNQVVGLVNLTPEQQKTADVNHDGVVDTSDALQVLKFVVGIIISF